MAGEVGLLEPEIGFLPRRPSILPVKVDIHPLLILVRDRLWLREPLEPGEVLFVVSPGLPLEFSSGAPPAIGSRLRIFRADNHLDDPADLLLIRVCPIVEDEKEGIEIHPRIDLLIV
jgi:hypothetical protein